MAVLGDVASPFKSKCQLEAENVALRHQVIHNQFGVRPKTADRARGKRADNWSPASLQNAGKPLIVVVQDDAGL